MTDIPRVPAIPSDPGLPGARGLLEADGPRRVARFLEERGWDAEETRAVQALYRPGRSLAVRYRVRARRPGRWATLQVVAETWARPRTVARAPEGFEARFAVRDPVASMDGTLVWAYPYDPSLREVPTAARGVDVLDAFPGAAAVLSRPLRYRPRRRAVFEYRVLCRGRRGRRWETRYGKVLPRRKAERIRRVAPHLVEARGPLRLATPVAQIGRHTVLLRALPGLSLRDLLMRGASLPSPSRVAALPARLAGQLRHLESDLDVDRPGPVEVGEGAMRLIGAIAPSARPAAERVLDVVRRGAGEPSPHQGVIHGDLYEAQVMVGDGWSLGLLDLDDLGPGDPSMDAANVCAHLLALALAVPQASDRLVAYRSLLRAAFLERLGIAPAGLAWREALAMLLLATGPFRVLDPAWPREVRRRVDLAVRLLG